MKIQSLLYPKPRTNLVGIKNKNSPVRERLVRPIYRVAKSVTKTSSKVQEPKTFNKVINDFILRIDGMRLSMRSFEI